MTSSESSNSIDSPWLAPAEPVDESITMPQTLAGVFDEAFDLYKRNFIVLATIVAVGLIPSDILLHTVVALWLRPLDAHLSGLSNPPAESLVMLRIGQLFFGEPRYNISGLLGYIIPLLLSAPISIAISDIYIGRTPTVKECYKRSRPYLLNMIGGYCLLALVFIGVISVSAVILMFAAAAIAGALSAVGLQILGIVLAVIIMVLPYFVGCGVIAKNFLFMTPLTVLEGLPASYVSFRNNQLVGKKRFWRTWTAASFLLPMVIGLQSLIGGSIDSSLSALHLPSIVEFVVNAVLSTGTRFFLAPYWIILLTLLYYDYRVRREGFDVRVLSLGADEAATEKGEAI